MSWRTKGPDFRPSNNNQNDNKEDGRNYYNNQRRQRPDHNNDHNTNRNNDDWTPARTQRNYGGNPNDRNPNDRNNNFRRNDRRNDRRRHDDRPFREIRRPIPEKSSPKPPNLAQDFPQLKPNTPTQNLPQTANSESTPDPDPSSTPVGWASMVKKAPAPKPVESTNFTNQDKGGVQNWKRERKEGPREQIVLPMPRNRNQFQQELPELQDGKEYWDVKYEHLEELNFDDEESDNDNH